MDPETIPLIGHPVRHRARQRRQHVLSSLTILFFFTLKSALAFLFSIALTVLQLYVLPSVLEGVPGRLGIWVGYYVATVLDAVTDGIWILVTVDLDAHFHRGLLGVELDKMQRDALRKCESLDTSVRIFCTKLPVAIASLILVFKDVLGITLAFLLGLTFILANILSRQLSRQGKTAKKTWKRLVLRNDSLYVP